MIKINNLFIYKIDSSGIKDKKNQENQEEGVCSA